MPAASPAAIVASTLILTINGQSFEAATADTPAARELAARAPFELNMQELNGNEKYASLDRALPAAAQSVGRIEAGDVMLWGRDCLVLFYASFQQVEISELSMAPLGCFYSPLYVALNFSTSTFIVSRAGVGLNKKQVFWVSFLTSFLLLVFLIFANFVLISHANSYDADMQIFS